MNSFPKPSLRPLPLVPAPVYAEPNGVLDTVNTRLNLNEAFGAPSPRAIAAATAALQDGNRYPDHGCTQLAQIITAQTGIPPDRITFGNGSDELLNIITTMAISTGDTSVMPAPTFPTCAKGTQISGGTVISVPLRPDGTNDVPAMLNAMDDTTRIFYLCTPNNPTGGLLAAQDLEQAAREVPTDCLLLIDEAYFEFGRAAGGPDVLAILANRTGPWIVTRSFSKAYCMAGFRVGYALTSDTTIKDALWVLRSSFNVNRVAQVAAAAAMLDQDHMQATLAATIAERDRLGAGLAALGFTAYPSHANFLTLRGPYKAAPIAAALAEHNLMIQALPWPDENGALRISIGATDTTDRLLAALPDILRDM